MRLNYGHGQCSLCRRTKNSWLDIRILEGSKLKPKEVCEDCLNTKEFFYADENNVIKYNRVETKSEGSIMKEINFRPDCAEPAGPIPTFTSGEGKQVKEKKK